VNSPHRRKLDFKKLANGHCLELFINGNLAHDEEGFAEDLQDRGRGHQVDCETEVAKVAKIKLTWSAGTVDTNFLYPCNIQTKKCVLIGLSILLGGHCNRH
jgi:hypothetical protein